VRYPVPAARARAEVVFDRSRFICTLARVETPESAQALLRELRAEFADATHNCWAYVAGPPGSTSHIGLSDDGEPHGTAGRPMLTVLTHCGVGEIAAIVTRYYGGTNLGTGGLVKAYSAAVQAALSTLRTVERVERIALTVRVGYAHLSPLRHQLAACEAVICDERFGEDVEVCVELPVEREAQFRAAVGNATAGQGVVVAGPA
jgi:uncharacterized YigZ family protein